MKTIIRKIRLESRSTRFIVGFFTLSAITMYGYSVGNELGQVGLWIILVVYVALFCDSIVQIVAKAIGSKRQKARDAYLRSLVEKYAAEGVEHN